MQMMIFFLIAIFRQDNTIKLYKIPKQQLNRNQTKKMAILGKPKYLSYWENLKKLIKCVCRFNSWKNKTKKLRKKYKRLLIHNIKKNGRKMSNMMNYKI